jgi:hypothetical protein
MTMPIVVPRLYTSSTLLKAQVSACGGDTLAFNHAFCAGSMLVVVFGGACAVILWLCGDTG